MPITEVAPHAARRSYAGTMLANVFHRSGRFGLEEKPMPSAGPTEAVVKTKLTTICGTDLHIVRGEYPVDPGLTIGHEAVGTIYELGSEVKGYEIGQRVLVGAITPCGQCHPCLDGHSSQCNGALGGWQLGNTIDGVQAEYFRVPNAQANLAVIPDDVSDEDALLLADIASTGFAAAESGRIRFGDSVAIFAQGPIGMCALVGARLLGAGQIFVVDTDRGRLNMSLELGASVAFRADEEPVRLIRELTAGRGVDVAIEALGQQSTFEGALKVLAPGGRLSSVGVYSGHLSIDLEDIHAGLADQTIVTTLCPGGKERMRRLLNLVEAKRVNLRRLLTHTFAFTDIAQAYEVFGSRSDGVVKVAIHF
jgi:threonine dehydrogenase-like Zn-dependent dehydrogenase